MSELHYTQNSDTPAAGRATVVLGLGNAIMGDDGAGLLLLDELSALTFTPPVRFVYGGAWGLALLSEIEDAESLLLLDIVRADAVPGKVLLLEGDDIPHLLSVKLSPHQVDVRELLALAALRGNLPRRIALVGVQARHVDLSTEISPEILAALPEMRTRAVEMLAAWGHTLTHAATQQG